MGSFLFLLDLLTGHEPEFLRQSEGSSERTSEAYGSWEASMIRESCVWNRKNEDEEDGPREEERIQTC